MGLPLAELPLEPQLGRVLLASAACGEEAVTLAALLSVPHLWTASRGAHRAQVRRRVEDVPGLLWFARGSLQV